MSRAVPKSDSRTKHIDQRLDALVTRIEAIDKRDLDQYETAKKIMVDSGTMMLAKIEHAERQVSQVRVELDEFARVQTKTMEHLNEVLVSIDVKLNDIATHGTALARRLDDQLSHVKVNGGTYPLCEAMQQIYKKLEEIGKLTEGLSVRKRWAQATKELIARDGPLHFIFGSKIGFAVSAVILLIVFNSITHSMGLEFDIFSIINWIIQLFK